MSEKIPYMGLYKPMYFCFDCGKPIPTDRKFDNTSCFCSECQAHYDQQFIEASKADTKQSKKEGW